MCHGMLLGLEEVRIRRVAVISWVYWRLSDRVFFCR